MIAYIKHFLNRLTMYQLMLYFLRVLIGAAIALSLLNILPFTWWHIAGNLAILIIACVTFNKLFSKLFKVKPNYESQYISAEILTLIVGPLNPLLWSNILALIVIGLLAMGSKYILNFKGQHVFNPAAFGVLAAALLTGMGASWWIGQQYMSILVLLGGLLISLKLRWFNLILSFLSTYLILLALTNLDNQPILILKTVLINSAILFFIFVMLVEPLTAPAGRKLKTYYGIFIAVILIILQIAFSDFPYSLESSLLIGNLAAFLVSRSPKSSFKLIEKQELATNTIGFWFEPLRPFKFQAGQFLEWTLPHNPFDSRGIRRWFTIASSPTEKNILLVTRLNPQSSSFKKKLKELSDGDELVAGNLDGDFILPHSKAEKLAFIAGGIGITPFRSMIKYLVDQEERRDIVLLYANKQDDEVAFKNLIDQACQKFSLKVVYVNTQAQGYIDEAMIKKEVPDYLERTFYVSGPEPMVESYEKKLKEMLIKKIKTDFFPGYEA